MLVSRTRRTASHNTTVLGGADSLDLLAELRRSGDGDIGVGGATLATALLRAQLLDELLLFTHPVVLGAGRPLFDGLDEPLRLDLLEPEVVRRRRDDAPLRDGRFRRQMISCPPPAIRLCKYSTIPTYSIVPADDSGVDLRSDVLAVVFGPDGPTVMRRDDPDENAWSALWNGDEAHDLQATGMLSAIVAPLAAAGVPVWVVSSFDGDLILVPADRVDEACGVLQVAGHQARR